MPRFSTYSEPWVHSINGHLADVTACIATTASSELPARHEGIPVEPFYSGHSVYKALRRTGARPTRLHQHVALARLIEGYGVTHVLVHFADFALRFEPLWQRLGLPVFVHCHGYDVAPELRRHRFPWRRQHPRDHARRLAELSRHVTFLVASRFLQEKLQGMGIAASRAQLKPLGVPRHEPQPDRTRGSAPLRIVFVGRLIDCKGPLETISAFELLREGGTDATLTVVGDGPLAGACRRRARGSAWGSDIDLTGKLPHAEVVRRLASSDLYTQHNRPGEHTRQQEAFGFSILEAMSLGLPVVATRDGGVPEIVRDGETGLLAPAGDVVGQAERLRRLAADAELRRAMGAVGLEVARSQFSPERERRRLREIMRID